MLFWEGFFIGKVPFYLLVHFGASQSLKNCEFYSILISFKKPCSACLQISNLKLSALTEWLTPSETYMAGELLLQLRLARLMDCHLLKTCEKASSFLDVPHFPLVFGMQYAFYVFYALGVLFSVIGGPCKRYAMTLTRMPCKKGPNLLLLVSN